jgi:hypothetical protein
MSVCLPVRIEHLRSHWVYFHEIWDLSVFLMFKKLQLFILQIVRETYESPCKRKTKFSLWKHAIHLLSTII